MITAQQVFDAAWKNFVLENNAPGHQGHSCRYLTEDGKKCAVGLCIPDGHPAQRHSSPVEGLSLEYPNLFCKDEVKLIASMQYELHDGLVNVYEGGWMFSQRERREEYINFAERHGLTIPE